MSCSSFVSAMGMKSDTSATPASERKRVSSTHRVGQIELLLPRLIEERSHLEPAALSLVEQGGEHRRRVELAAGT